MRSRSSLPRFMSCGPGGAAARRLDAYRPARAPARLPADRDRAPAYCRALLAAAASDRASAPAGPRPDAGAGRAVALKHREILKQRDDADDNDDHLRDLLGAAVNRQAVDQI